MGAGIRILVSETWRITWCKWNELEKKIFKMVYLRVVWGECWVQMPEMKKKTEE